MAAVEHDTDRNGGLNLPLPEGWVSARLAVIAESLTYGYTASAKVGSDGPRFLRITDLQNGRVDWNSVPTCQIGQGDVHKYSLHAGDIVFARTGATTGKSFLIRSCPSAVFASYLIRLRLLSDINPAFLAYFFQTSDYWSFVSDNVAGIAQPNCNATKLSELKVAIPPSAEQKRLVEAIAALLSKVDAARGHLSRVPAILKRFRQAVLAAACSGKLTEDWRSLTSQQIAPITRFDTASGVFDEGDLPELPEKWVWTTLGALASAEKNSITDGPFGSNLKTEHYTSSGPRVIRLQNIGDSRFVDVEAHVSNQHFDTLTKHQIRAGDVAIACLGDPVPRACLIPESVGPAIVKADCVRFKPNPEVALGKYVCMS